MEYTRAELTRCYLAGVSVANDMFQRGLIQEADYSALETVFAQKFLPLFRYEKPCKDATLPIRQTEQRERLRRI